MRALEQLAKQDLSDPASVKTYHSNLLAAVFKAIPGQETRAEPAHQNNERPVGACERTGCRRNMFPGLATALRCTDAVKFMQIPCPFVTRIAGLPAKNKGCDRINRASNCKH